MNEAIGEAFVVLDRIARATFAVSGAYLAGSYVFGFLGALVWSELDEAA